MDEAIFQRRLKKAVLFVAGIGILLLITCGVLAAFLRNAIKEATNTQMIAEVEEYKHRIMKQIDTDFQILDTLSSFIALSDISDADNFAQILHTSNLSNDLISIAFFKKGQAGILTSLNQDVQVDVPPDALQAEGRQVIENAWAGERTVSRLFQSAYSDERVFVCGVPILRDGNVVGALAASDNIEIFSDILNGNTVLGGNGYIHMLSMEGAFLIRSERAVIQEEMQTIFDGHYISSGQVERIQRAMAQQERIFSSFQYDGDRYLFLLEPVGLNGWYLFCVNTMQDSNRDAYRIVRVMGLTFIGILALIAFLLIYGYRTIRKSNRELIFYAYHDPLTGADNLMRFTQKLEARLPHAGPYCVAALNVHQFKFINEIFGRDLANRLLCHIKAVLDEHLTGDEFFCRERADSFYIYMKEADEQTVRSRLDAIMAAIAHVFEQIYSNYQLLLYCGAVMAGTSSDTQYDVSSVMTHVLFALASAKGAYHNNIWFYDTHLHEQEIVENYVESHMHQALLDGEFKLYLQPKMKLADNTLGGAEALVRWITGSGTMLFPDQFIPLFEKNGFCTRLDMYMVECACRQIRTWLDAGIPPVGISVNQTKLLFFESDYIQNLSNLIERYRIPADLITLEILEGLAMENVEALNAKIELLQARGFKVSMDDFGSGYSSLNTLGRLNIDELKLDRAFLQEISDGENPRARLIMEQIVQLTKRLQISTVVEGVETAENERLSRELGCEYGQGYYYSKPISAAEFDEKYMHR